MKNYGKVFFFSPTLLENTAAKGLLKQREKYKPRGNQSTP
jgi:hypothetical protein